MHPVIVIEWSDGVKQEIRFDADIWNLIVKKTFDPASNIVGVWRKYPVLNTAA